MIKTASLLLAPLFILTACGTFSRNEHPVARFALRDEQIVSWTDRGGGVEVHLTNDGQRALASLVRRNPGQDLEIYADRIFAGREKVDEARDDGTLFVELDGDVHDLVTARLPPLKKA